MKEILRPLFAILMIIVSFHTQAQQHAVTMPPIIDTTSPRRQNYLSHNQIDVIDIGLAIVHRTDLRHADTVAQRPGKVYVAPLPGIGYSLNTGLAAVVNLNLAFYTSSQPNANISEIETSVNYTQMQQFIFPVLSSIWLDNNKYNIQGNWLFAKFPQATYGLGGHTSLNDPFTLDYNNVRVQTAVYKAIAPDVLVGPGYTYDYFWNVHESDVPAGGYPTDLDKYGYSSTTLASAITLNFLYDTRRNSINPVGGGSFANIIYRPNLSVLGSDANWQSLIIDLRKYIKLPSKSHNILAFWAYEWFTFGPDKAPYVLLPNTGGDPYGNTGRGYSPGRFRGTDMLYLEGEYRYHITHNGLVSGVVFCNLESFPEPHTNNFEVVYPGYGAGLRIKFNKYSRTNIAIDYAFGIDGSRGFFINLGEVF